ncbi:MAG: HAD family hydrolase [Bacilli bacterium]|nr:HAD family hydrolase [Bacilli bacterium]
MIKRIIFDLDNTLIMWQPEYINALKKTIEKYNNGLNPNYINDLIDNYELEHNYYDKKLLLEYINKNIIELIDMNFVDEFLYNIGFMSEPNQKVIETLEYLNKKYELVVLTNWFTKPQTERLKHAKIDKYFKEIIGAEKIRKPYKESFINACGNNKPDECLMIGDNYDIDVIGAHNAGLKVLYFNNNLKENKLKFDEIKNIIELMDIL